MKMSSKQSSKKQTLVLELELIQSFNSSDISLTSCTLVLIATCSKMTATETDEAESGTGERKELEGFDQVFPLIGGHHRYQWLLLAIISLGGTNAFHHLGYTFLGAIPNHWCKIDELSDTDWTQDQIKNISIPFNEKSRGYDKCTYYDLNYEHIKSASSSFEDAYASINFGMVETKPCTEWIYDTSIYKSTVVTQFNLVCDRKHLTAAIQGTYMAGVFVGSLILGALSDRVLGRRGCILVASALIIIGGFSAWFAQSYTIFVLCRFLIAIGAAGLFQNRLTILMEYCDASSRAAFGFMQWVPFCVIYALMPVYAYFLRDWRDLHLAFCISTLVLISYIWIIPESSRWLASKNRDDEAIKILEQIARINKHPVPNREELVKILESCKDKDGDDDGKDEQPKPSQSTESRSKPRSRVQRACTGFKRLCSNYVNLVRTPELRRRSFILWILFMSCAFVYYGIAFLSPTLSNDPFTIVFIGALVEFPAYIGAIPLAKWGRKPATALTFLVSGFACVAISFVPDEMTWLRVTLSMVGKLFITGCFSIVYLLATELYPTSERATGVGASALMGRFGSISAPYVAIMTSLHKDMPTIIFAIVALIAGVVALLLPETKNTEMLEHIDRVEAVAARGHSATATAAAGKQEGDGILQSLKRNSARKDSTGSGNVRLDQLGGPTGTATT